MTKLKLLSSSLVFSLAAVAAWGSPDKNLRYKVDLLGVPFVNPVNGLGGSIPTGLNEAGKVVGYYPVFNDAEELQGLSSFVWSKQGGFEDLGLDASVDEESGLVSSYLANSINEAGDIAGIYRLGEKTGAVSGRIWERAAFVRRSDATVEVFAPVSPFPNRGGFFDAVANGINNYGEVAGQERVYDDRGRVVEVPSLIWGEDGTVSIIDTSPDEFVTRKPITFCSDINDQGTIAGSTTYYVDGRSRGSEAFIWNYDIGTVRLGGLDESPSGSVSAGANAINENEEVVGSSQRYDEESGIGVSTAFYWSADTGMVQLPSLDLEIVSDSQFLSALANDINDAGIIVGSTRLFDPEAPFGDRFSVGRATIWIEGEAIDLNDLLIDSDLELIGATGINDKGQITAVALGEKGSVGVLLTPPYQSGEKKGHADGHPGLR